MDVTIQALLASIVGASDGWFFAWAISFGSVPRRICVWSRRLCHGLYSLRHMAAHFDAGADNRTGRWLRIVDTGLRRLEVETRAGLEQRCAVYRRRNIRYSGRYRAAHLQRPRLSTRLRWFAAGDLRPLRLDAPTLKPVPSNTAIESDSPTEFWLV